MILNYFKYFLDITKTGWSLFLKKFFKNTFAIWLLIVLQTLSYIGFMLPMKLYNIFDSENVIPLAITIVSLIVLILSAFFVFKKVFNMATDYFAKPKLTNGKIIASMLALGIFNLLLPLLFFLSIYISLQDPSLAKYFKNGLNVFAIVYYISLNLSIATIAYKGQKANVFGSIFHSIAIFYKNILKTLPAFGLLYAISQFLTILICTGVFWVIARKIGLDPFLAESIHAVINANSIYLLAGFYIGTQVVTVKSEFAKEEILQKLPSKEEEIKENTEKNDEK